MEKSQVYENIITIRGKLLLASGLDGIRKAMDDSIEILFEIIEFYHNDPEIKEYIKRRNNANL